MSNPRPKKRILGVLAASHFSQHLWVGVAVLYPYIMADLGLSYTEIGFATGAAAIVSGLLQLVYSIMSRYFPRRLLLGLGNTLYSAASVTISISKRFYQLVIGNVLGGIGMAAQHPVSVSILADRFGNNGLASALGVFYGLGYLGNIIGPLILTQIAIYWGWRNSLLALSIIPVTTGLSLVVFLRGADQPTLEEEGRTKTSLIADAKSALKNKSARMMIAAQAFLSGATDQSIIVTYTALFLKNGLRLGSVETSLLYSTTMIAGVLGTLIVGRYADRIGSLKMARINTLIASTALLALGFQSSLGYSLILNLIIVGLFGFPIFNLMQAHISSISKPAERDILIGIFFTIGFGISSLWATLIGYTIDVYGSFSPAWTLMAGLGATGALLQLLAYRSIIKGKKEE
jgi:predicted MFS family arabinose efflux permease